MAIRPIGKNKWQIDYYPQGRKGKRIRVTFQGTQSEALIFEMELRRQNSGLRNPINPKIADIIPEFLEHIELHLAPATCRDYIALIKFIRPHFGSFQVSRITPSIVTQYQKKRKGMPRRPGCTGHRSINKELICLQSIIRFMVEREYANKLPFKFKMLPYQRPDPKIPEKEDIEKFLEEVKDPIKKAMIYLMYKDGLRWKEVRHLVWENISWKKNIIYVVTTKGSRPRICVLTKEVKDILEPIKKDKGWIFENPQTGKPYKSLKTLFRLASKRAGIPPIRPHLLRHYFATIALEANRDLRLVQNMVGHKSVTTTEFYTHITTERIKEGMKRIDDYTRQLEDE